MFVEVIDSLRCPAPHADSWLVATAARTESRRLVEGALGCPVCGAEYAIRGGVAFLGDSPAITPPPPQPARTADDALRLAAQLALEERGGRWLLHGTPGALARDLLAILPVELILIDPPAGWTAEEGISVVRTGTAPAHVGSRPTGTPADRARLPIADRAFRGAAFGAGTPLLDDAPRVIAAGGRLVAPAATSLPAGVRELARDDARWVGTVEAPAGGLVPLRRRPASPLFEDDPPGQPAPPSA